MKRSRAMAVGLVLYATSAKGQIGQDYVCVPLAAPFARWEKINITHASKNVRDALRMPIKIGQRTNVVLRKPTEVVPAKPFGPWYQYSRRAGLVSFVVTTTGEYSIAAGNHLRYELTRNGRGIAPSSTGTLSYCQYIGTQRYALSPGQYVIQILDDTEVTASLMVGKELPVASKRPGN